MLVTAIPDLEPLRIEMNLCFAELRSELDRRFAGIERRLHAQTCSWA